MTDRCDGCGRESGPYTTKDFKHAAFLAMRGLVEVSAPTKNARGETLFHFGPEARALIREYPSSDEARHDQLIRYFHGLTRR